MLSIAVAYLSRRNRDSATMNSANKCTRSSSEEAAASLSAKTLWRSIADRENSSDGETGLLLDCLEEAGRDAGREEGRAGDSGLDVTGSLLGIWKICETGRGEFVKGIDRTDCGGGVGRDLGGILGESFRTGDFCISGEKGGVGASGRFDE